MYMILIKNNNKEMKNKIKKILIAKDGFPLERFKGRHIINLIRKILYGSYYECKQCYENRTGIKVNSITNTNK